MAKDEGICVHDVRLKGATDAGKLAGLRQRGMFVTKGDGAMRGGLSVHDLSFSYGPKKALDGVSLQVQPGQFCALLGPNGAGKSTLVSLLTRLLVAPSGEIHIAGHDLRTRSSAGNSCGSSINANASSQP